MVLQVKTKIVIEAMIKRGKGKEDKAYEIQTVGPYITTFQLGCLHAFSDDDVKYIMKAVPEYEEYIAKVKAYVDTLEGDKSTVLRKLQDKHKSLIDTTTLDMRIQLNVSRKHKLILGETIKTPYRTDIPQYDPFDNNMIQ